MPETPPDPRPADDLIEATVLDLLVAADAARPWSIEEIGLEIGSELKARDAVAALYRVGLAHYTRDGFAFATRAAVRASELQL